MMRLDVRKVRYNLEREAAKISALSSSKIDKYEYVPDEILKYCLLTKDK